MFDNISKFFDVNPLIGIIIIMFLIAILCCMMNKQSCGCNSNNNEHLTAIPKPAQQVQSQVSQPLPQCTSSVDVKFNASYVGPNKLVNFKTKISGKDYLVRHN